MLACSNFKDGKLLSNQRFDKCYSLIMATDNFQFLIFIYMYEWTYVYLLGNHILQYILKMYEFKFVNI